MSYLHRDDDVRSIIDIRCIEHHMACIGEMEKLAEKAHKSVSERHCAGRKYVDNA